MSRNKSIKEDSYIREFLQLLKGRGYFVAGVIPFILGIIGYYIANNNIPDFAKDTEMGEGISFFIAAAYKSIRFYVLEYDTPEEICNNFLEIARGTAPIVTISGIAAILGNIVKHFKNRFLYAGWSFLNCFKKLFKFGRPFITIAFYGNDDYESKTLKENLVKHDDTIIVKVVEMHKHIPRADLYILFSDDDDNFDFYQKHSRKLDKFCRINSRKEKNRLLSREVVKKDFKGKWTKRIGDINLKDDNKYIIMKTERYSIKDEISDYITLVNMQELGAFKFWPYRGQGIYYDKDCHHKGLYMITSDLIHILYKNRLIRKDLDSTFVKDYVDYLKIGSIYLNYLINIDRDYVYVLCEEIRNCSKELNRSLRFKGIKKLFSIEDNFADEFCERFCKEINKKLENSKCITLDKENHLEISIIGDNEMAEHLLFTGLQLNIFNKEQKFTYNLFGDGDSYLDKHENLVNNAYSPNLISCSTNIINNKNVLKDSDVIIVCTDNDPKKIVDDLLLITKGIQIDLISSKQDLFLKYKSNDRVNFYNYIDRISNFEDFVEDNLNIDNALKACKNKYGEKSYKEKLNDFIKEWNNRDSLYRYNYICQEEFFEINDKCSSDNQLRKELNQIRKTRFSDFYNYPESKLD